MKLLLRVVEGYWDGWRGDAEAHALCRSVIGAARPDTVSMAIAAMLIKIRLYGREALRAECARCTPRGAPRNLPQTDALDIGHDLWRSCDACFSGEMGDREARVWAAEFVGRTDREEMVSVLARALVHVKQLGREALRRQCCGVAG